MGMLLKISKLIFIGLLTAGLCATGFHAGWAADNTAPSISPIARLYVVEGELLEVDIQAFDGDGDALYLWTVERPDNAGFIDNGDGTAYLDWRPDFTGPNSSEGSPFRLAVWASDGSESVRAETEIIVINNNRKPVILAADTARGQSGEEISFEFTGSDPDHDPISWAILDMPGGAEPDLGERVQVSWATSFADSGYHTARVALYDQYGAADTALMVIDVAQTTVFAMTVDTTSGYPGELVTIDILLENLEEVASFNLLVNYDYTALTFASVSLSGTRCEHFEYFSFHLDENNIEGDVRLVGIADVGDGFHTDNLAVGSGPIVTMQFYIINSSQFAGYAVPVTFSFRDVLYRTDNTMTGIDGTSIEQEKIQYANGYVRIEKDPGAKIGDINMNGIPFEIADAIYFTNYFINPVSYPLSPQQLLISDVNQDGFGGTIADLVNMINNIINFGISNKPIAPRGAVAVGRVDDGLVLSSQTELGGLALTLELPDGMDEVGVRSDLEALGLTMKTGHDGDVLRVVILGENGERIPSGTWQFITFDNAFAFDIREIQIATADGALVTSVNNLNGFVPDDYALSQNYPNPFNPSTEISFYLPNSGKVTLTVFNLLGRNIVTLVDRELQSGSHTVVWDGREGDGSAASSGMYFYRITAGDFSDSKKMILLK